ncbi:MAG: TIGR03032 family protein [Bauldia sp.]|nr:TIGR03032 family protein [Bauldia sp.]
MKSERATGPDAAGHGPKPQMMILSPRFPDWMRRADACLVLTTYQAGRVFFIGRRPDGSVRAHERMIEQCQGLWTDGQSLWTSGLWMLWRFENGLAPGETTAGGADRRFIPREARVTGRIDMHDIGLGVVDGERRPIFVNTLYSCLATVSDSASFRPLWHPPFISRLAPEDRCHLNGLAMAGGRPAYVSAVSESDVADGWRDDRRQGGVVLDVASGERVAGGLSMPHSPRLYDGRLWILNSGTGEFGTIDPDDGRFTPVCFCPGYARGLAFAGRHAVIGLSRPRGNQTFEGLPLGERLAAKRAAPRCGLIVVDIDSGTIVEWLRFQHTIDELYDVAVMPGVRQAEAVGFVGPEIETSYSL